MKRQGWIFWILIVLVLAAGCGNGQQEQELSNGTETRVSQGNVTFTDALGYEAEIPSWERVVSLYGSFAETWLLAGGQLTGTTSDAVEERQLELGADVSVIGSVKEPSFEEILALNPDFVILSADIANQVDLHASLSAAGIPHAYFRVDTFQDYLSMLERFCGMTGRSDLLEKNGYEVETQINRVLETVKGQENPSVLLIRAFSTGAKAKGEDNLAGVILRDLGADNLVSRYESLLEDLSMEEIIAADPDYIFVVVMGSNEDKATTYMKEHFENNPAWKNLSAVENGRYLLLPKELFHYKPNKRWGESYGYLAKILYPELTAEID